jgi:DNA-binding NarL/FixJ family response regulator
MVKAVIIEGRTPFRQTLENIFYSRFPSVETRTVEDGKQAMGTFESFLPDLILVNVNLPDENGLELSRRIKKRYPNVILILLASHDMPEYRKAACASGADYFITKESALDDYIVLMKEALSGPENLLGQDS